MTGDATAVSMPRCAFSLDGVRVAGVWACLPERSEDNLARCVALYGDERKAAGVVKATGIAKRRVAAAGVSSLDLCMAAARALLEDSGAAPDDIRAVVCVTFTPERQMPCNACRAQSLLGLPQSAAAFDINLACSGWPYGLYVAGLMAKAMGGRVLLLDGDVQTTRVDPADGATVPVLADAGTATLVEPAPHCDGRPWRFSFMTDGANGDALALPFGGAISMDGFGVFKFATMDVLDFINGFMESAAAAPDDFDAFVPHQANVYMVRQIAKRLGFSGERTWISGDEFGNSASASVPVTIAHCAGRMPRSDRRLLAAGFGGGLSASVCDMDLPGDCSLGVVDYEGASGREGVR